MDVVLCSRRRELLAVAPTGARSLTDRSAQVLGDL